MVWFYDTQLNPALILFGNLQIGGASGIYLLYSQITLQIDEVLEKVVVPY